MTLIIRQINPYVQWGLKNPSNFLLRVADKVGVDIQAEGHLQPARNPQEECNPAACMARDIAPIRGASSFNTI
jgi:hypothetical protein